MTDPNQPIEALLAEKRVFPPSRDFHEQAIVRDVAIYAKANKDPEAFWAEAAQSLDWFQKWDKVLDWKPPQARWFVGGKINVSHNCLDRHVATWRRNKAAIIWEGEPGEERVLTYADLYREVNKFANVLKRLGVKKGDRVDASSTVGLAGRNPSGNPSLYFELRVDGKPVDPLQWLKRH